MELGLIIVVHKVLVVATNCRQYQTLGKRWLVDRSPIALKQTCSFETRAGVAIVCNYSLYFSPRSKLR